MVTTWQLLPCAEVHCITTVRPEHKIERKEELAVQVIWQWWTSTDISWYHHAKIGSSLGQHSKKNEKMVAIICSIRRRREGWAFNLDSMLIRQGPDDFQRTSPINEHTLCITILLLQPVESDLQQTLRLKKLDHETSTEKRRIYGFTRPSSSSRFSYRYSSSLSADSSQIRTNNPRVATNRRNMIFTLLFSPTHSFHRFLALAYPLSTSYLPFNPRSLSSVSFFLTFFQFFFSQAPTRQICWCWPCYNSFPNHLYDFS